MACQLRLGLFGAAALLALTLILALVPGAQARYGVTNTLNFPQSGNPGGIGGSFSPGSVVNLQGLGGGTAGEIFTAGSTGVVYDQGGTFLRNWSPTGSTAIDHTTGEIVTAGNRAVTVFDGKGAFLRRFGFDTVDSGPNNSNVNEKQQLRVFGSGGTFTFTCCFLNGTFLQTKPIPYNAPASEVEDALNELSGIQNAGDDGTVAVTGGPGNPTGANPYVIEFTGTLAGNNVNELFPGSSDLEGGYRAANISTIQHGGDIETCLPVDVCKSGFGETPSATGGMLSFFLNPAIAPAGAPNAGNYVIGDGGREGNKRTQEFTPSGEFVRAFGWDVVKKGPNDSSVDEQVRLTVKATGGAYALSFGGNQFSGAGASITGAVGHASSEVGSNVLTVVSADSGAYQAGQTVKLEEALPANTTIESVGAETLTLSNPATQKLSGAQLIASTIPYNATAAQLETALNAMPLIGGVGGSVEVTGGPGDAAGSAPYLITFKGTHGGDNVTALTAPEQSRLLQGTGAVEFLVRNEGGAFETCIDADGDECKQGSAPGSFPGQFREDLSSVAVDSQGNVYETDSPTEGNSETGNFRVTKFSPSVGGTMTPSLWGASEVQKLTVRATAGQFRLAIGSKRRGTSGVGNFSAGSTTITNVFTTKGEFSVGMPISASPFFQSNWPDGTTISAVSGNTLTTSKPPFSGATGGEIHSDMPFKTGNLPFNATAAEVEAALEQIQGVTGAKTNLGDITAESQTITRPGGPETYEDSQYEIRDRIIGPGIPPDTVIISRQQNSLTISKPATATTAGATIRAFDLAAEPGGVTVTGGPEAGGASYEVSFDTGYVDMRDVPPFIPSQGATPLSGGSGAGANEVAVETLSEGGPNGFDFRGSPYDVAVDDADNVYVARAFVEHTAKCPDGSTSPNEVRVQKFTSAGDFIESSPPCTGPPRQSAGGGANHLFIDPATGEGYMTSGVFGSLSLRILNEMGPPAVLTLDPPSNISSKGVTISGEVTPNGPLTAAGRFGPSNTVYRVELKKESDTDWEVYAPNTSVGVGGSPVDFNVGVSGLTPKTPYEFKVVVSKPGFPAVTGPIQIATTDAAPPTVDAFRTSNLTASSADLHALINPLGTETTYHFEYGKTTAYGQSTPEALVGSGLSPVAVQAPIDGLEPVVYHFRVVATSAAGVTTTSDQTFNFYPEPCPNETVRQQTGSGDLPDCRAYEIVSPADANGTTLVTGGPNSPFASDPPRLSFLAIFGTLPGEWNPPNVFSDLYSSTRTSTGWETHYVGLSSTESVGVGKAPGGVDKNHIEADRAMDSYLDWSMGQSTEFLPFSCCGENGSMAPYMWSAENDFLGRLPTTLGDVPNGAEDISRGGFMGDYVPSAEFDHYFFSSANVAFAPGGKTANGGSAYDNDVVADTTEIVSKLPNGNDIPQEPGNTSDDYMELPKSSRDGSHILMKVTAEKICGIFCGTKGESTDVLCILNTASWACPAGQLGHLYMRVDNAVSYDVSRGHVVKLEGMTEDGGRVYFTTAAKVTGDDNDTSVDLFMWQEQGDQVIRLSAGTGTIGDTDACNAAWTARCGIDVVDTEWVGWLPGEEPIPGVEGLEAYEFAPFNAPRTDEAIARQSGDVYFMSPEQFVGSEGVPGRRNLYVRRDGDIQFVATLDADDTVNRMNVSANGDHAAFITASRLTAYDNVGYRQMYTYDAETGEVVCVSCDPTGAPPSNVVHGSQDGRFMAEDGRAFFGTREALSPKDTDGMIDVYEYVDGRPHLISSGAASVDVNSNGIAGLVGVSADGINVYFGTFTKLVEEDANGEFLRFYVARTNGGFPRAAQIAPCAAADECHAPDRPGIEPPEISSTANLGTGGNHQPSTQKKAKKKQKKRKKKRRGKRTSKTKRGASR